MKIDRGALRLGAEIEVAAWKNRSYTKVAQGLLEDGYMLGVPMTWQKTHDYHCQCQEGGCYLVRQGRVIDPPIVSMTYDATLPTTGAEFIMSPILVNEESMSRFKDIWHRVVEDAIWTTKLKDKKGRLCSPSIHLHVSAIAKDGSHYATAGENSQKFSDDILHAISLFSPELFFLADMAGVRRGIMYRLPDRHSIYSVPKGVHHGFIQMRKAYKNKLIYIEWRLFEAAYGNWNYVEQCAYLAASLTRSLLDDATYNTLMAVGYDKPYSQSMMVKAVADNNTDLVLEQVNPDRFETLAKLVTSQMDDDQYALEQVSNLFEKARSVL